MPDKVWFKIGETARLVGATPKELRYWERVIPELQPRRSKGNLRYYHQDELVRLERIRQWLSEGFTVADCRELLKEAFPDSPKLPSLCAGEHPLSVSGLQGALDMLHALRARLSAPAGEALSAGDGPVPWAFPKPPAPAAEALFRDGEIGSGTPEPVVPPKRVPKPRPQEGALGRMWSGGRLPLDLED